MSILSLIRDIGSLINELQQQVKIYTNNYPKLLHLISVTDCINDTLEGLDSAPEEKRKPIEKGLTTLYANLIEIQEFTTVFMELINRKDWYGFLVSFFEARKFDARMTVLETKLDGSYQRLTNGITLRKFVDENAKGSTRQRVELTSAGIERASARWIQEQKDISLSMSLRSNPTQIPVEVTQKLAFLEGDPTVTYAISENSTTNSGIFVLDARLPSSVATVVGLFSDTAEMRIETDSEKLSQHGLYKLIGVQGRQIKRAEGIANLMKAAESGDQTAMYNLGVAFEKGYTENGLPNLQLALEWYIKAYTANTSDTMAYEKTLLITTLIQELNTEFECKV